MIEYKCDGLNYCSNHVHEEMIYRPLTRKESEEIAREEGEISGDLNLCEWNTCAAGHYGRIEYTCGRRLYCREHIHPRDCCRKLTYENAKAIREGTFATDGFPAPESRRKADLASGKKKPEKLKEGEGILCFEGCASVAEGDHHTGAVYACYDWGRNDPHFLCEKHRDEEKCCRRIPKDRLKWARKKSWEFYVAPFKNGRDYGEAWDGGDGGEGEWGGKGEFAGEPEKLPEVKFAKTGR